MFDVAEFPVVVPQETEPSLEGLLRFCERWPSWQRYDYTRRTSCLLAQYRDRPVLRRELIHILPTLFREARPTDSDRLLMEYVAMQKPWTFGAAAERCRAYIERAS
jgi:hypothetical protein